MTDWTSLSLGNPTYFSLLFIIAGVIAIASMRKPKTAKQYLLSRLPHPQNIDWAEAEPKRFCPFTKVGPLTMGLERIDPEDWLLVDHNAAHTLQRRQRYMEQWGDGRLVIEDSSAREAVCELWEQATTFAVAKYPSIYNFKGGIFYNKINGSSAAQDTSLLTNRQILMHLSLMFEEDFFLMAYDEEKQEYAIQAAAHAHPTGFNPKDVLGASLSELHAPVPGYQERLRNPMTRFFARLKQGTLFQRLNWSCQQGDLLCLPSGDPSEVMQIKSKDGAAAQLQPLDASTMNLRVERQTLRRLPRSQSVLFTVRTYLYPLNEVKGRGLGGALRRAIDSLDWHFAQYKGRHNWGDAVKQYMCETSEPIA